MDCWWIDEAPYPGPPAGRRDWDWREFLSAYSYTTYFIAPPVAKKFKPIVSPSMFDALVDAFNSTKEEVEKVVEVLKPLYTSINPEASRMLAFHDEMSYAERREHALRYQQNRNTGPRDKYTFNRNGTRLT